MVLVVELFKTFDFEKLQFVSSFDDDKIWYQTNFSEIQKVFKWEQQIGYFDYLVYDFARQFLHAFLTLTFLLKS